MLSSKLGTNLSYQSNRPKLQEIPRMVPYPSRKRKKMQKWVRDAVRYGQGHFQGILASSSGNLGMFLEVSKATKIGDGALRSLSLVINDNIKFLKQIFNCFNMFKSDSNLIKLQSDQTS